MQLIVKEIPSRYWLADETTPNKFIALIDGKEVAYADSKEDAESWGQWQLEWIKKHSA